MAIGVAERVLELVDLIYASVEEPTRWSEFMERLADASHGASMVFFSQDVSRPGASVPMSVRIEDSFRRSYETHYNSVNPWMRHRPELLVPGRIAASEEMCPTEVLRRSEYFNDWLKPQGFGHCLGGMVLREGPLNSVITAFRSLKVGPASLDDWRIFQAVLPHLQRGVQLYFRLLDVETGRAVSAAALDRLTIGVVLVDGRGAVLLANRAARSILDLCDGLSLTVAGVRAARRDESELLARLIAEAAGVGRSLAGSEAIDGIAGSGGAIRISRPSMKRSLSVLVTPLHAAQYRLGTQTAAAALFISDPEGAIESSEAILCRLYRLTRAEAALAVQLVSGRSVDEAAEALGVASGTARIHLKRIFSKTGVHRQSELMKLLLAGPGQIRMERDASG